MLFESKHTTAKMLMGNHKIPRGWDICNKMQIISDRTGDAGALIRNKKTGAYALWDVRMLKTVPQWEAVAVDRKK